MLSLTTLRGLPVQNRNGEELGSIQDLVIETDRGAIAYAILVFGGDKTFALPFSAFDIDLDQMTVYVDLHYEVLEEGSGMTPSNRNRR